MAEKKFTCSVCGKSCDAKWEDQGLGPVEFWGALSHHEDWQWVTDCCEAGTVEEPEYEDEDEH